MKPVYLMITLILLLLGIHAQAQTPSFQWATSFKDSVNAIVKTTIDFSGNVYITGSFYNSLDIGDSSFTSKGKADIFIAKYNSAGHFVWANHAGGATEDFSNAIAIDESGNSYITGVFTDTAYFGSQKLVSIDSAFRAYANVGGDIFIAKYDSNGRFSWVKQAGSKYSDRANAIALDKVGNIYICGAFGGYQDSDPSYGVALFDSVKITALGFESIFIANMMGSVMPSGLNRPGESFNASQRILMLTTMTLHL